MDQVGELVRLGADLTAAVAAHERILDECDDLDELPRGADPMTVAGHILRGDANSQAELEVKALALEYLLANECYYEAAEMASSFLRDVKRIGWRVPPSA